MNASPYPPLWAKELPEPIRLGTARLAQADEALVAGKNGNIIGQSLLALLRWLAVGFSAASVDRHFIDCQYFPLQWSQK